MYENKEEENETFAIARKPASAARCNAVDPHAWKSNLKARQIFYYHFKKVVK
jgi:hypothetical protein